MGLGCVVFDARVDIFQFDYFYVVFLRRNKVCGDQDGERKVARVRDRAVSESGIGQEGHQYPFPIFLVFIRRVT